MPTTQIAEPSSTAELARLLGATSQTDLQAIDDLTKQEKCELGSEIATTGSEWHRVLLAAIRLRSQSLHKPFYVRNHVTNLNSFVPYVTSAKVAFGLGTP